jgi:hypothetical protein
MSICQSITWQNDAISSKHSLQLYVNHSASGRPEEITQHSVTSLSLSALSS